MTSQKRPEVGLLLTTIMTGLGGGLGAMARWGVESIAIQGLGASAWIATFIVNIIGAFMIGLFFTWLDPRFPRLNHVELQLAELPEFRHWLSPIAITGGLGAFTTYSSFSLDTVKLIEDGMIGTAIASVGLSLAVGLLAVAGGMRFGMHIWHEFPDQDKSA
tara:strand:- start:539 stop:1021 length:483 start_codon:yes stop_codon:yes gene_type:complete